MNFTDEVHAEIGAGYKKREGDEINITEDKAFKSAWTSDGVEYDTWSVLGGIYYQPVDQLTIGLEAEYYTTSSNLELESKEVKALSDNSGKLKIDRDTDNFSVDLVTVWRF